jgi:hypothetical protein
MLRLTFRLALLILVSVPFFLSCTPGDSSPTGPTAGGSGSGGGNLCSTGYCYSYVWGDCCPRSAPYDCNHKCYTYTGGGGCTDYKTTCY